MMVLASALTIVATARSVRSDVVSSSIPSADAFVTTGASGGSSQNNYGSGGALAVSASGKPAGEFQSVLRFDLAASKASFDGAYGAGNWSIRSATLKLTASSPNNPVFNASSAGNFTIDWMRNNSWVEGSGTPSAPSGSGINFDSLQNTYIGSSDLFLGTFAFDGSTSGAQTYVLQTPTDFLNAMSSGGTVSFRLHAADSAVSYLFNSRTFGTDSARPVLSVTAVPEPVTLGWLLPLSLLGTLRRRHRVSK